jgi:hypothetical protein
MVVVWMIAMASCTMYTVSHLVMKKSFGHFVVGQNVFAGHESQFHF